eukprot:TRINITY_DN3301_c0_g1_i4.p1 TRINITY_DN3301_c0_g1~~TRINITY_DN3301_c0_g1_i4.p1  ORF type:complete len:321 (-),score=36.09 TRINITY_DN3301_c0_g1_i4:53-1015(-)
MHLLSANEPPFIFQELANAAWAFASVAIRNNPLMSAIAQLAKRMLEDGQVVESRELCNIAWSFATVSIDDNSLFESISKASLQQIHRFRSQGLSNMAWSLAQLVYIDRPLIDGISDQARSKLKTFRPQELSNTAWAMATLSFGNSPLMADIAEEAGSNDRYAEFSPKELRMLLWALSHHQPENFEDVCGNKQAARSRNDSNKSLGLAWKLMKSPEVLRTRDSGGFCWQSLLAEAEQQQCLSSELRLVRALASSERSKTTQHRQKKSTFRPLQVACVNVTVARLLQEGQAAQALRVLEASSGSGNSLTRRLMLAVGATNKI